MAYAPGAEARVRYGMLLKLVGRTAEARVIFNELLIQMKRAPKHARDMQAEWLVDRGEAIVGLNAVRVPYFSGSRPSRVSNRFTPLRY